MNRIVLCALAIFATAAWSLRAQTFTDVTVSSGIFIPPYTPPSSSYIPLGRGCAWDDFDGDGDQDVFSAEGPGGDYAIWWNTAGTFSKQVILAASGSVHHDHQVLAADVDRNGHVDVYVVRGEALPNLLFMNQGGGVFTEEGVLRGVADTGDGYAASFGDVDRDGWLDLYVGNYLAPSGAPQDNVLFRNNGLGNFVDVTSAAGVSGTGVTLAVLIHDINGDGWPELIAAHDKGAFIQESEIFRNDRNGTFTEVGAAWNANMATDAMGLTVGDVNRDGSFDLFSTDQPLGHTLMLWDPAAGAFEPQATWDELSNNWGISALSDGWACFLADYDLDGVLDLFYTQTGGGGGRLFSGLSGPGTSVDRSVTSGLSSLCPPTYCATPVDYDDDGDLDLFIPGDGFPARLLRNDNPAGAGHFLKIDLQGTLSNPDGIGAIVSLRIGTTTLMRPRLSGEGFLSDADARLHFGLGTATEVAEVEVRWPSGTVQYIAGPAIDQTLTITEPQFLVGGSLAPGSATPISLSLPDDAFIPYICGLTSSVLGQVDVGGGRYVLTDLADPLLALTTVPGNSGLVDAVGFFDPMGVASMTLNVPPVPQLSGFSAWLIGVSWNPLYPSNIKSIVGPQLITIP